MYVISLAAWRRRFGPWVRTLLIAVAVLFVLFVVYRLFAPARPVGAPYDAGIQQAAFHQLAAQRQGTV